MPGYRHMRLCPGIGTCAYIRVTTVAPLFFQVFVSSPNLSSASKCCKPSNRCNPETFAMGVKSRKSVGAESKTVDSSQSSN